MSQVIRNTVKPTADAPKCPDGVVDLSKLTPGGENGVSVFVHYNGSTAVSYTHLTLPTKA